MAKDVPSTSVCSQKRKLRVDETARAVKSGDLEIGYFF
jgi:hypothetical protein